MKTEILNHFELLGTKVEDKVTGYTGVVTCLSFDLYGCIQVAVTPKARDEKTDFSGRWFDITRLSILDRTPVMPLPDFTKGYVAEGKKGPASKPSGRF